MRKTLLILLISTLMFSCTFEEKKNPVCRIENATLIDVEKGEPIKEFNPISQNAVIKLSKLPTKLGLKINLSSANCAPKVASLIINDYGGGGRYIDEKPPFAYPPDNSSWLNLLGSFDYKENKLLTELRGERIFIAEILNENDQIIEGSEYKLNFTIEE